MNRTYDFTSWHSRRNDVISFIAEIHRLCGTNNIDILGLPDWLGIALDDIHSGLVDFTITAAPIIDRKHWDEARLRQRGECAKPCIELYITLTSHGNLSVLWHPRFDDDRRGSGSDFPAWGRHDKLNDWRIVPLRPNNELLFVHYVTDLVNCIDNKRRGQLRIERRMLYASRALTELIVKFLSNFCETRVITDFHFNLNEEGEVISWSIVNMADHWVETFGNQNGIAIPEFLDVIKKYSDDNGHLRAEKASRSLRDCGLTKMMPKVVETLKKEFEYYRQWPGFHGRHPELFRDKVPVTQLIT